MLRPENCIDQEAAFGLVVKARESRRDDEGIGLPTPFRINPLHYFPDEIPGIEMFIGNTSSYLRTALMIETGKLSVSHPFLSFITRNNGVVLNRRLVNIATGNESVFETMPHANILRSDGQTYAGELYRLLPKNNGNLLAAATAFVDTFKTLPQDQLKLFGVITGLKTIDSGNIVKAIEIIKSFGLNPDKEIMVRGSEGDASSDPSYLVLRKMHDGGFIDFNGKSNLIATINKDCKTTVSTYAQRIAAYEEETATNIVQGVDDIFQVERSGTYEMSPTMCELIAESLRIYKTLSIVPKR